MPDAQNLSTVPVITNESTDCVGSNNQTLWKWAKWHSLSAEQRILV